MTRLTSADVQPLLGSLDAYDQQLKAVTGLDLAGLSLEAAGLPVDEVHRCGLAALHLAVVPITSGLGLIGGFARSVCAILDLLGCQAFVTNATDVAGLAEAIGQNPSALFMSDDNDFMALDPRLGTTIHNTPATARGFVTGMARMAGGLKGKKVLLLGCGPLGSAAAEDLLLHDAQVVLYDVAVTRCTRLRDGLMNTGNHPIEIAASFPEAAAGVDLIFDATNTADPIDADVIGKHTRIAAPGMPCGITTAARRRLGHRLLHDPLQIGVATMAAQILTSQILAAQLPAARR